MPKADGQRKGATPSHNAGPRQQHPCSSSTSGIWASNRLHCTGLPEQPGVDCGAADLLHPPISSLWQPQQRSQRSGFN